jgi:hypothetical protein
MTSELATSVSPAATIAVVLFEKTAAAMIGGLAGLVKTYQ